MALPLKICLCFCAISLIVNDFCNKYSFAIKDSYQIGATLYLYITLL